jgi:hypothetical protein
MSLMSTITTNRRRFVAGLATALLVTMPALSATASTGDLRSPDARDAARAAQQVVTPAATGPRGDAGYVGLNTPLPNPALVVPASRAAVPGPSSSGVAWGYVALMVGLAVAAGMGVNEGLRRRRLGHLLTTHRS